MSLYVPEGVIHKREKILIADDILRSGETQRALIKLAERSEASICGIFVIISIGDTALEMGECFYSLVTL
jgi:adenine/guanine phosphoribosyltransferase-like PRPP-binding protein